MSVPQRYPIVDQAKLLLDLLRSSPPDAIGHHRPDFLNFVSFLLSRCFVTHSVSPRFPARSIERLVDLCDKLSSGIDSVGEDVALRRAIESILDDIVERNVKFAMEDSLRVKAPA